MNELKIFFRSNPLFFLHSQHWRIFQGELFRASESKSNSAPTKALVYGRIPRGMKLKDPRDQVKQLEPGVTYRLELKAGRFAGSTTFQAKEHPAPEAAAQ